MWNEEDHFSKKELKKERKQWQKSDRSKYKKTDQKEPEYQSVGASSGRVLRCGSQHVVVQTSEGTIYLCSVRGALKKERTKEKNLIIVGDEVTFDPLTEQEGVIVSIVPRRSLLSRQDNLHRLKKHLIAANVDQVLITQSCVLPALKPAIIDRYLIAAEKGQITPVLVFNKIDLANAVVEEKRLLDTLASMYRAIGIEVFLVSATTGEGMQALSDRMKGKTSVFSGQSGTGKTSLINAITGLNRETGAAIVATNKGAHTTSSAQLLELPFGGYCVDTPGIRSFGIWDLEAEDIRHYFSDFLQFADRCSFRDCTHRHEPGCHILKMVQEGLISSLRYDSYVSLYNSLQEKHLLR